MSSSYTTPCGRCGKPKPRWFQYCGGCYAAVQLESLEPNRCAEQDCSEAIREDHYLCRPHWEQSEQATISKCPQCGEFKPASFSLCRRCNADGAGQASGGPRPYDRHDASHDPKAEDKMYWFHHQDNGICNYCGRRYPYDQLEVEHLIPKDLGGPDHRRNTQLACKTCNGKKGTSTDMEFRELNSVTIPRQVRTPSRPSIDPQTLQSGEQGPRYREPTPQRARTGNPRTTQSGRRRNARK